MREKLHATVINYARVRKIPSLIINLSRDKSSFLVKECIHVTVNMILVMCFFYVFYLLIDMLKKPNFYFDQL